MRGLLSPLYPLHVPCGAVLQHKAPLDCAAFELFSESHSFLPLHYRHMASFTPCYRNQLGSAQSSPWAGIQRALESTAGSVLLSCKDSREFSESLVEEWEKQLSKRSERLAEAIGLEICSWTGDNRAYKVSAALKDNAFKMEPDRRTKSTIIIPLRLVVTSPHDPTLCYGMNPPPLRLFSQRVAWEEAVDALGPHFGSEGVPGTMTLKALTLLKANIPAGPLDISSDQLTGGWYEIGAKAWPHFKRARVSDCRGSLRVTGTFSATNAMTAGIGPLTMFFDTDSATVHVEPRDLFPSLTSPSAAERENESSTSGSTAQGGTTRAREPSLLARWHDAIEDLKRLFKNNGMHHVTIAKISDTIVHYPPAVRTIVPEALIADWRFQINVQSENYTYKRRIHCKGTLVIAGEVVSITGSSADIKPVEQEFDTKTCAEQEHMDREPDWSGIILRELDHLS